MGGHLIDGEFQSDKYPDCPRGKVPLSTKDPSAQPLLWIYAELHRAIDPEFSDDVQEALRLKGFTPDAMIGMSMAAIVMMFERSLAYGAAGGYCGISYKYHGAFIRIQGQPDPEPTRTTTCSLPNGHDGKHSGEEKT